MNMLLLPGIRKKHAGFFAKGQRLPGTISRSIIAMIRHGAYWTEFSQIKVAELKFKVKVPERNQYPKKITDLRDVGDDVLPVFCLLVPSKIM